MMGLLIRILYVLLPVPGVVLYLAGGGIIASGFDDWTVAPVLGISAFSWLAGQFWLAARFPGAVKALGLPGLNRLHGSGGLLVLVAGSVHWYLKFVVQMAPAGLQTLAGTGALVLVLLSVAGAVLFLSPHFPSPAKALKGLRKSVEARTGLGYKAMRALHNATVVALVLAQAHVLLAFSTRQSWMTTAWMAFLGLGGLAAYLAYRMRGRKWTSATAGAVTKG